MEKLPKSRSKGLVVQKSDGETLLYDVKNDRALCLNETSSLVWKHCNGKSSFSQIAERLSNQLKVPIADEFVGLAIDQLKKEGLLENSDDIETGFEGQSRRDVIREVGFASLVTLPIVSSLVAPTAANAQSCLPPRLFPGVQTAPVNCAFPGPPCNCFNVSIETCCSGFATADNCIQTAPNQQRCECTCAVAPPPAPPSPTPTPRLTPSPR